MKTRLLSISLFLLLIGCDQTKNKDQDYLRWIGDIPFDEKMDDQEFKLCNTEAQVLQYFNMEKGAVFIGEKPNLLNFFQDNFRVEPTAKQSGWIRIRFIVNCEGKAGRHRMLQADEDFKETMFSSSITEQLFNLTKEIEIWPILERYEKGVDYYFYLTFKMKDGQIEEILP